LSTALLIILFAPRSVWADEPVDLLGPSCGDQCQDLLHPSQPAGPDTRLSIAAEWLDRALHTKTFSKAMTVFDFEAPWVRGSNECGPGCAVVDVSTKGVAAIGGITVAATFGLALSELGPPGEAVAASVGVLFADQLEHVLRNLPGFGAAREDLGGRINNWIQ